MSDLMDADTKQSQPRRSARTGRTGSERDAETRVVEALRQRGFNVRQDVPVPGAGRKGAGVGLGRVDILAERVDTRLVVEMKRPERYQTERQQGDAKHQARRYADRLGVPFVATSDGDTLTLEYDGELYLHQLVGGFLLPADSRKSPLDLGADYATFSNFCIRQRRKSLLPEADETIEREVIFDLAAFVAASDCDALLIAGEAGSGKTTYAHQLVAAAAWDPLWIDGGAIDDPRQELERSMQDLTGFTGDLRSFLETLQGYRQRDNGPPCGVIVDAVDEWVSAQRHLPELLRFAKDLGLKVVIFGRARSIDLLLENERLAHGITVHRLDLHQFTEDERERSEQRYIKRFDLRSSFTGRAKDMSRLPEMMAMISEAYAGEAVDPELTEAELYDRYRGRKCSDVARRAGTDAARIQGEIDAIAGAMLQADTVALPFTEAAEAAAHLDWLLVAGTLRKESAPRTTRVRFRFGRIRDDALANRTIAELFASPIVGRSVASYAAATNTSARREYLELALSENVLDALFLTRETGWWREFADLVPTDISERDRSLILSYASVHLTLVPQLLVRFAAEPHAVRLAIAHKVDVPITTWRVWLEEATARDAVHDVISLTHRLLVDQKIELGDAIWGLDLARTRVIGESGFSDEGFSFWPLVGEICDRLNVVAARRFLRQTIPTYSLTHSSSSQPASYYQGISYSVAMLKCVDTVRGRSSARAFEAWASATLLRAYATEWQDHGFDGRELTGSATTMGRYGDNGWVLDVIVPATRTLAADKSGYSSRLRHYAISCLHPAFRLRAMILASPINELEALKEVTLRWRRDRSTGIPAVADALDARASESRAMREQALDDALERFGMPLSTAQADAFHERLAAGNQRAIRYAERFLADPRFQTQDVFNVEFFQRLDWAQRRPILAAKLVRIAIISGYDRFLLARQGGYGDVLRLALTRPRLQRILADVPDIKDEFASSLRSAPSAARARLAESLYNHVGITAKRNIIHLAHELPRPVALRLLRQALCDDARIPDACSEDADVEHGSVPNSTLHDDIWFELVMCYQRWPKSWFRDLGENLIERAERFQAPVAVAATIAPIERYVIAVQRDRSTMHQAIDFLFEAGLKGGDNLRHLVSATLGHLYLGMTEPQRERFFVLFKMTEAVATASFLIACHKPDDHLALERALEHARATHTGIGSREPSGVRSRVMAGHSRRSKANSLTNLLGTLTNQSRENWHMSPQVSVKWSQRRLPACCCAS